jgi:hypothetical protein
MSAGTFDRRAIAAQQASAIGRIDSQAASDAHENTPVLQGSAPSCESLPSRGLEAERIEPLASSSQKQGYPNIGGAESGALGADNSPADPNLTLIVETWPILTDAIKAGILAMVLTVGTSSTQSAGAN